MSDDVKALIAEARKPQFDSVHDEAWGVNGRSPADRSGLVRRLADALEAATVAPAVDREALGDIIRPHIADEYMQGQVSLSDEVVLDDIFASGILRDVRDVQAEALEKFAAEVRADVSRKSHALFPSDLDARAQAIREARND